VGGALLAENAGAALEEIEQVSHQIASLVHNISGSAREQNVAAAAITRNMDVLRDVSAKTKQSTTATSSSISKLSELASQLRKTVSGFKLPPDGKRSGAAAHEMQMGNTPSSSASQAHGDAGDDEFDAVARDLAQRREAVGDLR
jgi:twitching motility protein PilJ